MKETLNNTLQRMNLMLSNKQLIWVLAVILLFAAGLLVASHFTQQTTFECSPTSSEDTMVCEQEKNNVSPLLAQLAAAAATLFAVPIIFKLWFWSGVQAQFLSALGVHDSLRDLGIIGIRSRTNTDWSETIDCSDDASLSIIAIAGLPLVNESSLAERAKALVAQQRTSVRICLRDPSMLTDNMFANRRTLEGTIKDTVAIGKELTASKAPSSKITIGTVKIDLKYTLVLGSTLGVYTPHPTNQTKNKSGQMIDICFRRDGSFFKDFLEHDVEYIFAEMTPTALPESIDVPEQA